MPVMLGHFGLFGDRNVGFSNKLASRCVSATEEAPRPNAAWPDGCVGGRI